MSMIQVQDFLRTMAIPENKIKVFVKMNKIKVYMPYMPLSY